MAHELDGILVAEIIRTFDRIVGVPFGIVSFDVAKRGGHAALRRARVRACGIQLADDRRLGAARGVQTRHQSRAARADNDHVKLMNICMNAPIANTQSL